MFWHCIKFPFPLTSSDLVILLNSVIVFIITAKISRFADINSALHAHLVVDRDLNYFNFELIVF